MYLIFRLLKSAHASICITQSWQVIVAMQARVMRPLPKEASKLPAAVKLTSPIALALAGAYRKAQGAKAPSLEHVATAIASALTVRCSIKGPSHPAFSKCVSA